MKRLLFICATALALTSCNHKPEAVMPSGPVDGEPLAEDTQIEHFHATIGDGTTMHIIQLVTPTDTFDIWFNDHTQREGALVIGAEIDATTRYIDGRRIAVSYKTSAEESKEEKRDSI